MSPVDAPLGFVVVLSGMPGSGKTTLGWELSRRLHVPFLSRDDMKTGLHVTHRSTDPGEVLRFAGPAFDLFYGTITSLVEAKVSLVAEAAFNVGVSEESIARLATACTVIHLKLTTPDHIALARYRERAQAGHRHPAHNDEAFAEQMAAGTKDVSVYRMSLPYPTLEVDGSTGWQPDLDYIVSFIDASR